MLLTPRTYSLAQTPDEGATGPRASYFLLTPSRKERLAEEARARRMLLLHQTGSVKVGEVVRYTVTYTPSEDRILPSPSCLHVKIRNSSAIALRAAYLHGPYFLHVAAYPSTFNPNKKVDAPKRDGVPEFEPNLKAGGSWTAKLVVPEDIREVGGDSRSSPTEQPKSATWVVEIASQVIFSQSASVSYELLVARDERSLDLGFTAVTGNAYGTPGQVEDHQQGKRSHTSKHAAQPKGVYSKAIKLVVDDTASLWNKPELPEWDHDRPQTSRRKSREAHRNPHEDSRKQKRIHLVVLTHGLHSNLGADMLFLKESIDATARQAREDRRKRKQEDAGPGPQGQASKDVSTAQLSGGQEDISAEADGESDDEEVVVRGFGGNVIRTERGIQYLGKRLAKHVLELTYPDQPFLPQKKSMGKKLQSTLSSTKDKVDIGIPSHEGSSIHHPQGHQPKRAYKYTSISFIGHSLGGLIQTYAIAYIYKHSPQFFDNIKPVNFVALASPFLGLSNENPMYVRFALDFGLVGRTGQDLGLTWRAPTLAKSGWSAMVSGFSTQSQKDQNQADPGAKPLLRILPTGPAHLVLRMFRNRTVYSNVVNDGIVPLRTSCLLFLDWRGLGKVEKARRENGLIGTAALWSWGQLTGQSTSPNPSRVGFSDDDNDGVESPFSGDDTTVPQPGEDDANQDDEARAAAEPSSHQFLDGQRRDSEGRATSSQGKQSSSSLFPAPVMSIWNYVRPAGKHTTRDKKMFKRSQTVQSEQGGSGETTPVPEANSSPDDNSQPRKRPQATRGDTQVNDPTNLLAPPKTTIFESAGDLLDPPVPPGSWIIDPSTRARTIFHDRVYHPEDIPPPPAKRPARYGRSFSSENTNASQSSELGQEEGSGGMKVEEKIARAYHKDLSWRKVLVSLEPDAHNNIVVRRMFANAYGWPVIKHLCDTHFADTYSAETRDENEPAIDRAQGVDKPVQKDGEHVKGQSDTHPPVERTQSELRESADELAPLKPSIKPPRRTMTADSNQSKESGSWDDAYFEGTSDDDDDESDNRNAIQKFLQLQNPQAKVKESPASPRTPEPSGTSDAEIAAFLASPSPMEIHRGLGASPQASPQKQPSVQREPDSLESMGGMLDKDRQTTSPPQSPSLHVSGSTSGVGLRTSFDNSAPTSPQEGRARSGSGGVTEQVARMSLSKDRTQEA
ncbi:putative serine esterase-domain-containing protein [Lophiotrema nucula]|uniref:Putative serine esterase-domain-containing protein n=1 Tax=Lophiotrema nucula TaxID=690887 RepID=A0A6A5YWT3_9PLEO|nr:putative serine esterase-domain-containing protein [Lophiotrema nucula]